MAPVGPPLQGSIHFTWLTQGVALGWNGIAPLGRGNRPPPKPQRGGLTGRGGPFFRRAQIGTHGVTNCVFPKPQRGGITPAQGNALGSGSPHPFQPQRGGGMWQLLGRFESEMVAEFIEGF
jgi:hypothetical protein